MAKSKKSAQATAAAITAKQRSAERNRSLLFLGASVIAFVLIIGAAIWSIERGSDEAPIEDLSAIGVSASAAQCQERSIEDASGNADHRDEGESIDYGNEPPASGPHWGIFMTGKQIRTFYDRAERPPLERLVHSMEHGHTVLWYDDTVAEDSPVYQQLKDIGATAGLDSYLMVAPYTEQDGEMPGGAHFALSHWTGPQDQKQVRQYCGKLSGAVVEEFMSDYDKLNAPEPGAP